MPRKFSTHVALSDGLSVHRFGPGDTVPEWATVGDHVLESTKTEPAAPVEEDDDLTEVETVVAEEQGPIDFTKPVQKRGPGRPRKSN